MNQTKHLAPPAIDSPFPTTQFMACNPTLGKIDLILRVNEAKVPAWFAATAHIEPVGAVHKIERYNVVVEVGLSGDTASYPCHLVIEPSASRHISAEHCSWKNTIAEAIKATLFIFPHFAEFLRQRASQLMKSAPG